MTQIAQLQKRVEDLERLEALVYDGNAVFSSLTPSARRRTSAESVSDVLDALAVAWRQGPGAHRLNPDQLDIWTREPEGQ